MRLLLIEDDLSLAARMTERLAPHGFVVEHSASAELAPAMSEMTGIAAMVVDIGLPGRSGVEFIRKVREAGNIVPILVLSARGNWEEKVEGLNAGADDYVVKPVRTEELVARLHALLRRAAGQVNARLSAGNIALDPAAKIAWLKGEELDLTRTEFRLLQLFLHHPGQALAHGEILDHLYPSAKFREANTVEVAIARLRRKIGKDAIRTIRGLGYRLAA